MSTKLPGMAAAILAVLLMTNVSRGQNGTKPAIVSQPQNVQSTNGGTASFRVTVTGTLPMYLKWRFNGTNLFYNAAGPGNQTVNTTNLILNNVGLTNAGFYDFVATNEVGGATSSVASLTVIGPPVITNQPVSLVVTNIKTVNFSVGVSGTGPFTYQWLFNGKIIPNNIITTVAGKGSSGFSGDGGAATNAGLSNPSGVAVNSIGNLFIADKYNNRIRKVTPGGIITTWAGNISAGFPGDGNPATNTSLNIPSGVAVDADDDLFIADTGSARVRTTFYGFMVTVAGNGGYGYSGDGGAAYNAHLNQPAGVAVDLNGNIYIADTFNSRIRKVDLNDVITTVAGTGTNGWSGDGGPATNANLNQPAGVAVDAEGNLFIADSINNRIRKVDPSGIITTLAGNGTAGFSINGGPATNAYLNRPSGVAVDAFGNVFFADTQNSRIRKVTPGGIITTVAGTGTFAYSGDAGPATNAWLNQPAGLAVDAAGNLFIADTLNQRVRKVTPQGPVFPVPNVIETNAGNYQVIVSNPSGSVTSSVAVLTVDLAPYVKTQPANQTVVNGQTATFMVTAGGTTNLAYQWRFNGTNLPATANYNGPGKATLLAMANAATAGNYDVIITNAFGSVTSSVVTLTVAYPPAITNQPVGQTIINGSNAVLNVGATGTDPLSYQWQFNGANMNDTSNRSGSATANLLLNQATPDNAGSYVVVITNAYGRVTSSPALVTIVYPPAITSQPVSRQVLTGGNAAFSVTATGTDQLYYQWRLGGLNLTDNGTYSGSATPNLNIVAAGTNNSGNYDVVITNVWGSVTSSVAALAIAYPPVITSQPQDQTIVNGSNATFSITAAGTMPLLYQWRLNGTNLTDFGNYSGSATDSLAISQAGTNNAGAYDVILSSAWGSVTSSMAGLAIVFPPAITNQPASRQVLSGSNVTFSAAASGTGPLFYHWQFNNTNLTESGKFSGTTSNTLSVAQAATNNAGVYRVIITNAWGSVTSTGAILTVFAPPIILSQPTNKSVILGQATAITVSAAGTAPLHYQWRFNGIPLSNGGNVFDVTSFNLIFERVAATNAGLYDVIITNAWGSITSSVASFIINFPPLITNQPVSLVLTNVKTAAFSVGVTGTGPFTYQWYFNGKIITNNLITTVAGNGSTGFSGNGTAATNASLNHPSGLALDAFGNLYIADANNNRIRKVDPNGIITTVAGNGGSGFSNNGVVATNSSIAGPGGVAVDANGNYFFADSGNNRIRLGAYGILLTVAGNGKAGFFGDGEAAYNAALFHPADLVVDAAGNLFIADTLNNRIRKVDPNDIITTVAGNAGLRYTGDGVLATNTSLDAPQGVALDAPGNLYIADTANERIRKVDTNGIITTVAGNGNLGYSGDGGTATNASLNGPNGVTVDTYGNLYIADTFNNRIRKVDSSGKISTVVGKGSLGFSGDGGAATNAFLNQPVSVVVDAAGNLYIADANNQRIRKVSPQGPVLTIPNASATNAGNYQVVITSAYGSVTSSISVLSLQLPPSIVQQPVNQVVANGQNATFTVSAASSTQLGYQWQFNGTNLPGRAAVNLILTGVTAANAGPYQVVVTNVFGSVTSVVANLTVVFPPKFLGQPQNVTTNPGNTVKWQAFMAGALPMSFQWYYNGTPLAGQNSTNLLLTGVTPASTGAYYLVASNGFGITTSSQALVTVTGPPVITTPPVGSTIFAGGSTLLNATAGGVGPFHYQWQLNGTNIPGLPNIITTLAGNGTSGYNGDGGAASLGVLNWPFSLCLDTQGNLYFSDSQNKAIRMVNTNGLLRTVVSGGNLNQVYGLTLDAGGNLFFSEAPNHVVHKLDTNGTLSIFAGNGTAGYSGDGTAATNASLNYPLALQADKAGNLYIADYLNCVIRKVGTNGIISTVAGNNIVGYAGDGGAATQARLNFPYGVTVDDAGNLFIADTGNSVVRKVDASGIITTFAGNGVQGYAGDGGAATNAILNQPEAVSLDPAGNLLIADSLNNTIRRVDASGVISTLAGKGVYGYSGDGGAATNAAMADPVGVIMDQAGDLFIADTFNNALREVIAAGGTPTLALNNVTAGNAGNYQLIITNAYGSVTSSVVNLTVSAVPWISVATNSVSGITLNLVTAPNTSSQVLAATNLTPPVVWQSLGTGTPGTSGAWQFNDSNASQYPVRFYRTSTP